MSTAGCDQAWRFICLPMGKKKKDDEEVNSDGSQTNKAHLDMGNKLCGRVTC